MKKFLLLLALMLTFTTSANAQLKYDANGRLYMDGALRADTLRVVEDIVFEYFAPDSFDILYYDGENWIGLSKGNLNEVLQIDSTGTLGWGPAYVVTGDTLLADWNTMLNIPPGFADDTDDEGVTVEVDPVFTAHLANSITAGDTTWWGTQAVVSDSLGAYWDSLQVIALLSDSLSSYFDSLTVLSLISDSLTAYTETDPIFTAHLANSITAGDTTWWGTQADLSAYWDSTEVLSAIADSVSPESDPVFTAHLAFGIDTGDTTWWGTQADLSAYWDSLEVAQAISDSITAVAGFDLNAYFDSTTTLQRISDSLATVTVSETDPVFSATVLTEVTAGDTTWWGTQADLTDYRDSTWILAAIGDSVVPETDPIFLSTWADSVGPAISDSLATLTGLPSGVNGDLLRYNSGWGAYNVGTEGQVLKVSSGLPAWGTDDAGVVESDGGFDLQFITLSGNDTLFVGQDSTVTVYDPGNALRNIYLSSTGAANGNFFRIIVKGTVSQVGNRLHIYDNDDSPVALTYMRNGSVKEFIFDGTDWICVANGALYANSPVSLGLNAEGSGQSSVAIGNSPTATATSSIAIGNSPDATAIGAIAIGGGTQATDQYAIGVGAANATNDYTIAIGHTATASQPSAIAIGRSVSATSGGDIAVGYGAIGSGGNAIVMGYQANTYAVNSIAIGYQSEVQTSGGSGAIAVGYQSNYNVNAGSYSTSIGGGTRATGLGASAIGAFNRANQTFSVALGYGSKVERYGETWLSAASDQSTYTTQNKSGSGQIIWYDQATAGVQDTLYLDGTTNSESFEILDDSIVLMDVKVTAWDATADEGAAYKFELVIKNDGGTCTLAVENKTVVYEDDATWDMDFQINDTSDFLYPVATGDGTNLTYFTVSATYTETRE